MKLVAMIVVIAFAGLVHAQSDHNNLEQGRPLRFDDAYSIAYGSTEFQNGFRFDAANHQAPVYGFRSELQYGFAKNRDFSIGWEPGLDSSDGRFHANRVELSYFEGLRREVGSNPAVGYRLGASFPVETGVSGAETYARLVFTKSAWQYDKVHLNLDIASGVETRLGAILGYSSPIGYARDFNTTLVGELGWETGGTWVGIGVRRQVSPTGVVDLGVQTRLSETSNLRLAFGYSFAF